MRLKYEVRSISKAYHRRLSLCTHARQQHSDYNHAADGVNFEAGTISSVLPRAEERYD
jgi:hypothetical protein